MRTRACEKRESGKQPLLVIRCVTSVRDEFGWHEVAQVRKLPEFFDGSPSGNCNLATLNNIRSKLVLLTCKQFCLPKRFPVCYKIDFQNQNTSHVVASLRT